VGELALKALPSLTRKTRSFCSSTIMLSISPSDVPATIPSWQKCVDNLAISWVRKVSCLDFLENERNAASTVSDRRGTDQRRGYLIGLVIMFILSFLELR
jgi:hypothetical protein